MDGVSHVFAIAPASAAPAHQAAEALPGMVRLTLPSRESDEPGAATRSGIEVYAGDPSRVTTFLDEAGDRALYLWGRAVHPLHADPVAVLRWSNRALLDGNTTSLRDLLGNFVLLVDDRRAGQVTFVSDVLGVRPWFVGAHDGQLVAGSDVFAMHDAGLASGRVDYTAVSCWLKYNYDWTGSSLFEDLRRLPPGAICTYDRAGTLFRQTDYAPFEFADKTLPQERIVADLHDIVTRTFDLLVRDLPEVNLPLSGGFDSRYLIALAVAKPGLTVHATNVESNAPDTMGATMVGEALGHPVEIVPIGGHTLDLFDDPFTFSAAGFPAGRNLVSAVARLHPGMPLLSGYLGDALIPDWSDRCLEKYQREFNGQDLAAIVAKHHTLHTNRLDLLHDPIAAAVTERALAMVRSTVEQGTPTGKLFFYANLFARQRLYIANQFLQHLDMAEAILPFYSWELINYRTRHAVECFPFDNYPTLFRRHFPRLAHIPHDSQFQQSGGGATLSARPTRHLRRWSMRLLLSLSTGAACSAISRRKLATLIPSGLMSQHHCQDKIMFLHKLHAFEKRLRRSNLALDWNEL